VETLNQLAKSVAWGFCALVSVLLIVGGADDVVDRCGRLASASMGDDAAPALGAVVERQKGVPGVVRQVYLFHLGWPQRITYSCGLPSCPVCS